MSSLRDEKCTSVRVSVSSSLLPPPPPPPLPTPYSLHLLWLNDIIRVMSTLFNS